MGKAEKLRRRVEEEKERGAGIRRAVSIRVAGSWNTSGLEPQTDLTKEDTG